MHPHMPLRYFTAHQISESQICRLLTLLIAEIRLRCLNYTIHMSKILLRSIKIIHKVRRPAFFQSQILPGIVDLGPARAPSNPFGRVSDHSLHRVHYWYKKSSDRSTCITTLWYLTFLFKIWCLSSRKGSMAVHVQRLFESAFLLPLSRYSVFPQFWFIAYFVLAAGCWARSRSKARHMSVLSHVS